MRGNQHWWMRSLWGGCALLALAKGAVDFLREFAPHATLANDLTLIVDPISIVLVAWYIGLLVGEARSNWRLVILNWRWFVISYFAAAAATVCAGAGLVHVLMHGATPVGGQIWLVLCSGAMAVPMLVPRFGFVASP